MTNKKLISIGGTVVILIVIALLAGNNLNSNKNTQQTTNIDTATSNETNLVINTPAEWVDTPITGNDSSSWLKVSLGANSVTQDGVTFSQNIIDLGKSISQSDPIWQFDRGLVSATGKYVQVDLTMNNETQGTESIQVVPYFLADQEGRGYQFTADQSDCGGSGFLSAPQILKPGIPCTAHLLFEVSQQSNSFNLDFDVMKNG